MSEEEIRPLKEELENHDRRISELENILKIKKELPVVSMESGIKKLSSKLSIPVEKIDAIYDREESILTVISYVGKDHKEQVQNIVLLTLFGYKIYFGKDEILSQEIRRNVAENRIALYDFGKYLNEIIPKLLRRKGKLKSPKTSYKLTIQGEVKAKDLIREIISPS